MEVVCGVVGGRGVLWCHERYGGGSLGVALEGKVIRAIYVICCCYGGGEVFLFGVDDLGMIEGEGHFTVVICELIQGDEIGANVEVGNCWHCQREAISECYGGMSCLSE